MSQHQQNSGIADGPSSGGPGPGSYASGAGAGASDPANTGLGGYNPSAQAEARGADDASKAEPEVNKAPPATSDLNEFNAQMDAEFNKGERERERERQREQQDAPPSTGDRLRGTAEQWAGQVTGDTDLQARGERRSASGVDV